MDLSLEDVSPSVWFVHSFGVGTLWWLVLQRSIFFCLCFTHLSNVLFFALWEAMDSYWIANNHIFDSKKKNFFSNIIYSDLQKLLHMLHELHIHSHSTFFSFFKGLSPCCLVSSYIRVVPNLHLPFTVHFLIVSFNTDHSLILRRSLPCILK